MQYKNKNIAILGGTFNPIHNGHIFMADMYNERNNPDIILFIPTNLPPHKVLKTDASNNDRILMCKLAIKDRANYIVSDLEYKMGGKSYTANTLKYIRKEYNPRALTFILGADMFVTFNNWYSPKEILKLANLAVIPRNSTNIKELYEYKNILLHDYDFANIEIMDTKMLPISSTMVRERIENDEDVSEYVPVDVGQYIKSNGIYKRSK